jgi:hypothetical protein
VISVRTEAVGEWLLLRHGPTALHPCQVLSVGAVARKKLGADVVAGVMVFVAQKVYWKARALNGGQNTAGFEEVIVASYVDIVAVERREVGP